MHLRKGNSCKYLVKNIEQVSNSNAPYLTDVEIRADRTENGEFDIAIEFSQTDDMNALYEDLFSGAIESALLDSIIAVRNFRARHSSSEIRKIY